MPYITNAGYNASQGIAEQMRARLQEADDSVHASRAGAPDESKSISQSMRESHGLQTGQAVQGADTVTISEEGRAKQQNMAEDGQQKQSGGAGGPEASAADPAERAKQNILKQIEDIKKKLEEAKTRLAAAGSMDEVSASGPVAAVEAEAAQAEVDMLNQRLQLLYQQLAQTDKEGGAASGSAGIGGAGGSGGLGERISVG